MILIYLLGMNPTAAFPIMMGSCAFLMPVSSVRFVRSRRYHAQAALGLAIGGLPAVLIAAYLVRSMPLGAVRWLVVAVVIFCTVTGLRKGQFVQVSDARTIYSQLIDGEAWSAIQITTAAGVCAALDLMLAGKLPHDGFVRQEEIGYDDFLENRFGRHFGEEQSTRLGSPGIRDFGASDDA